MFDLEQHEKALKAMNERILKGEKVDVQKEISRLFGEDTFLFKLKTYLTQSVNSRISYKMKDRYNNERTYFALREKIEEDIIKDENWYSYFKDEVTIQELEDVIKNPIVDFDTRTLMLIVIEALKAYVDNGEELNVRCLLLRKVYLNLKETLTHVIVGYPQEDGFLEYSRLKNYREEMENARISGSICPHCGSHSIKSYGSNWKCCDCDKEFRKHRKKEEES